METLTIEVTQDHIDRIAKAKKPILGIAELIWNSLDADAQHVNVRCEFAASLHESVGR